MKTKALIFPSGFRPSKKHELIKCTLGSSPQDGVWTPQSFHITADGFYRDRRQHYGSEMALSLTVTIHYQQH